jgi:arsenite methyltransferase
VALTVKLDLDRLRGAIQEEYAAVAACPTRGYHFHVGRAHAARLGYDPADLDLLPETVTESFAGIGNPFALGRLRPGEWVVEVGSGAGMDALIAAAQVGPTGRVVGVDMTDAMLAKARANAAAVGAASAEFRRGFAEALPVEDGWADVVVSNSVINLCPDKDAAYREVHRVLKPGGRVQIVDTAVKTSVPADGREDIALWPAEWPGLCWTQSGWRSSSGPVSRTCGWPTCAGTRSAARRRSRPTRWSWAPSASR